MFSVKPYIFTVGPEISRDLLESRRATISFASQKVISKSLMEEIKSLSLT